jgi:hypothetical protein
VTDDLNHLRERLVAAAERIGPGRPAARQVIEARAARIAHRRVARLTLRVAIAAAVITVSAVYVWHARAIDDRAGGTTSTVAPGATGWAIQPTLSIAGAGASSSLSGVSCMSTDACMAVGSYSVGGEGPRRPTAGGTFAERWNGANWAIQSISNDKSPAGDSLSAVSCPTTSSCTAVGNSGAGMLVEHWNGITWATQRLPSPKGATRSLLSAVSCSSPDACVTVGQVYLNDVWESLTERWNGSTWAIEITPNQGPIGSFIFAVSCPSNHTCTGVGSYYGGTVTERWNGAEWVSQPSPNPKGYAAALAGVSCPSTDSCTAVGHYNNNSSDVTTALSEQWNGSNWVIEPTPNPNGAKGSDLESVSCSSASSCTAVGSYTSSANQRLMLVERWNGTTWATESAPGPSVATGSELSGVSCPATNACTAVGGFQNPLGETLAERWTSQR